VLPFLKQFPEANGKEAKSLEKDLKASAKLNLLSFSLAASDAAKIHCADLTLKQNGIGHNSSDGKNFSTRMRLAGITKCAAENIYTGKNEPLLSLIMLLLRLGTGSPGAQKKPIDPLVQSDGGFHSDPSIDEPGGIGSDLRLLLMFHVERFQLTVDC